MSDNVFEVLSRGEIEVEGRLVDASNATLYVSINFQGGVLRAIYKPIAGERPLWDFPDGNLASRERAAFLVSQELGYDLVPLTILRDGPFGFGMVQQWIDIDESIDLELFFREKNEQLRKVVIFDAVINNTDRKIGHLLPTPDGSLYICDHGVTFHQEDKLRTVLWQWAGEELRSEEIEHLQRFIDALEGDRIPELSTLITPSEINSLRFRTQRLIADGKFPTPSEDWPAIPWPPF